MSNYTHSYVSNRTSKLVDYGQITDQLYDPLRVTISRASHSPHRPSSQYKPVQSRVSRIMHQLTPEKADQMKRTTYIPVDKKLVPTNHVYKVRGKKFQAIDLQERAYEPITAQQMQYIIDEGRLNQQTETVYEFQDDAIYYDMAPSSKLSPNYGVQFQRSQYCSPPSYKKIKTQPCIFYNTNQMEYQEGNNFNSMETYIQQLNSHPNYSFNPSFHDNASRCVSQNLQTTQNQSQPYHIETISRVQNRPHTSRIVSGNSYVSSSRLSVSKYSFKDNIDRRPINKPSNKYKYNLFSALDFAVNNGCKGCGANQVIAKTPSRAK